MSHDLLNEAMMGLAYYTIFKYQADFGKLFSEPFADIFK
jgi:hypothetical protein